MRRLLASRLAAGVVCLVLVALIAVGGALLLTDDGDDLPTAPQASVDVAHDFALAATTFDYRRIEQDRERVLAFGSAELRRDFASVMGDDFAERAAEARRVSVGEIVAGPTVQRVADGRATLLVVLNQRVVSDGDEPNPQVVRVSMLVTVETDDEPQVTRVQVL
jgi:hypothetical protein